MITDPQGRHKRPCFFYLPLPPSHSFVLFYISNYDDRQNWKCRSGGKNSLFSLLTFFFQLYRIHPVIYLSCYISYISMFAVIKTGGKQYVVSPDQTLSIEKINGEPKETVVFDNVLLIGDEGSTKVGTPTIEGAKVEGTILRQARERKKLVFKYKSKTRQRKTQGHRQHFTQVKITNIKSA